MKKSEVKKNTNPISLEAGMTYVELIVVLAIFSLLSSVAVFNHGKFQAKVDVKNLANDIALKIVQAQKFSISGKWDSAAGSSWKPAYGVYFSTSAADKFIYFSDIDNTGTCNGSGCSPPTYALSGEVRDIINITKGNTISTLVPTGPGCPASVSGLSIVFKRPDSSPIISTSAGGGCTVSDILINITSPQSVTAKIRVYASGRIQIE